MEDLKVIEVRNITKSYGSFYAVKNLSFDIKKGLIYGLLGPNGAGKTTTIRMIMNIIVPDSGNIKIFGQDMDEALKSRIGYLPEDRGLYPKMRVGEVLLFLAELKGMKKNQANEKIDHWLKKLDRESR